MKKKKMLGIFSVAMLSCTAVAVPVSLKYIFEQEISYELTEKDLLKITNPNIGGVGFYNLNYKGKANKIIISDKLIKSGEYSGFVGAYDEDDWNDRVLFIDRNTVIKTIEWNLSASILKGLQFDGNNDFGFVVPSLVNSSVEHVIFKPNNNMPDKEGMLAWFYSGGTASPKISNNSFATNSKKLRLDFYTNIDQKFPIYYSKDSEFLFTRFDGTKVEKIEIHVPIGQIKSEWAKELPGLTEDQIIDDLKL